MTRNKRLTLIFTLSCVLLMTVPMTGAQQTTNAEKYRAVAKVDGLSCAFTQDISANIGSGFGGTMSASTNHFKCIDKAGKEREIELINNDPSKNAGLENGKVAIRTRTFGVVYRGNSQGTFGTYEMTDTQIKNLKAFLGL
jgi:hypothetical protein